MLIATLYLLQGKQKKMTKKPQKQNKKQVHRAAGIGVSFTVSLENKDYA